MNDIYLPQPKISPKKHIAPIWLLPIIALLVGVWLVWRSLLDMGPTITIEFENGEGIVANQTPVKYKGITIGMVKGLHNKEDLSGVLVDVEIDKRIAQKRGGIPKEAEFWLVEPQVTLAGVSGLGTIFSGNYIGVQLTDIKPGGETADHFVALKAAPPLPPSVPGLHINFKTDKLGSIGVGAPVYSRQVQVGSVQTAAMAKDGSGVEVGVFILPQYASMVRKNTRFWNASGLHLEAGLGGITVDTESVVSMLAGGISMSLPDEQSPLSQNGDNFYLYQDFEAAETSVFVNVQFPTAEGLTKGVSKVMYKGMTVGKLRDVWYSKKDNKVSGRFGIDPRFESFITDKTKFWLVRPQLSAAGISGLDALVSGAYLTFSPDPAGVAVLDHNFVALDAPPPLDFSEEGLHLRLTTSGAGSLMAGMPVYYREFVVGSVQSRILENDTAVIHVLIKPEYRSLVNRSSRFWNVSGFRMDASLSDGIQVQSAPLAALMAGGITFDTPDSRADKDLHDGQEFRLFDSEKLATAVAPGSRPGLYLTLETPDAGGIQVGAPILNHDLPVGSVEELRHSDDGKRVLVRIHIKAEHSKRLDASSRFWRASAVELKVSTAGLTVRTGSAAQFLGGGIAFDSFTDGKLTKASGVRNGDRFLLYTGKEEAVNAGVTVKLQLADATGLGTGSEIRYRGIALGEITRLQLRSDLKGVDAEAALKNEALPLLASGSRIWKVKPAVGLARTENLDALLGSYLALRPGTGSPVRNFLVEEREPVVSTLDTGLNLQLTASQLGSLKSGDPVLYRQVKVGHVLGTDLSADGSTVQIYLNIEQQYAGFVRSNSQFWNASGLDVRAGLFSGVDIHSESIESLVTGGIAFATPDKTGNAVQNGQLFELKDQPEKH
jgi:paraquat-inducible protein B